MAMSTTGVSEHGRGEGSNRYRVFVVENNDYVREGLARLLDDDDELVVTGSARSAEDALPLIQLMEPDVVVSDVRLPGMDGYELSRRLTSTPESVPVLLTTTFTGNGDVSRVEEAGAAGYIDKQPDPEMMRRATRTVASGQSFVDPRVQRMPEGHDLTPAQMRVLQLLASQLTYEGIGLRLHVTENTIKGHVQNIFARLDAHNRAEAVAKAYQRGLIRPEDAKAQI